MKKGRILNGIAIIVIVVSVGILIWGYLPGEQLSRMIEFDLGDFLR